MDKRGPWKVVSSDEVYSDSFITVRRDEVVQPDGEPGTYATVKVKPGVAVLAVDDQKTAYLVRQFRYALGAESLEVVGGGCDKDEEPEAAARRETLEELGIEAADWTDMGVLNLDTSIVNNPTRLFLARKLSFREPQREGSEVMKTERVPLEKAVKMVQEGAITHAASVVLILKAALLDDL